MRYFRNKLKKLLRVECSEYNEVRDKRRETYNDVQEELIETKTRLTKAKPNLNKLSKEDKQRLYDNIVDIGLG